MDLTYAVYAEGAVAVLFVCMLVTVLVARTLDRDKEAEKLALAKVLGVASSATRRLKSTPAIGYAVNPLAAIIAASNKDDDDSSTTPDQKKQAKAVVTTLAIIGGLIAIIAGILKDL
jgi:hypothetical protein